jgi:hypothetical protein
MTVHQASFPRKRESKRKKKMDTRFREYDNALSVIPAKAGISKKDNFYD